MDEFIQLFNIEENEKTRSDLREDYIKIKSTVSSSG
jgi:hypothetical protein